MQDSSIPVHKVILLYIVGRVPGIRRSQLFDAALASLSMDYFDLTLALDQLVQAQLIQVATRKGEALLDARDRAVQRCDLTEKGQAALDSLESQIPATTRRFLTDYLDKGDLKRRLADMVTAQVEETPSGHYRLTCRQEGSEGDDFQLSLLFPSEALAKRGAQVWRDKSHEVYTAIIQALLPEDKEKP